MVYVDMVDTTHPRRLNCGNLGGNHTCAVQHLFRFIMGSFVVLLQTTVLATTSTVPTVPTWRLVHNRSGRVNIRRDGNCRYLNVLARSMTPSASLFLTHSAGSRGRFRPGTRKAAACRGSEVGRRTGYRDANLRLFLEKHSNVSVAMPLYDCQASLWRTYDHAP
jgi:hypothetical protein